MLILTPQTLQGDDEKSRGMNVSPYMDRNEPQVAKLQASFISHMVFPLANAISEAGLLPIMNDNDTELLDDSEQVPELIMHLRDNQQRWQSEIDVDEGNEGMEVVLF
jgi:cGMP-inhibited 3',5'-cyclic phosphodiesterase A